MSYHLKTKFFTPLSREYEAWLTQGIENYFKNLNIDIDVFAFSQHQEANLPTDELFHYRGKMFGLQVKRVKHENGALSWIFSDTQHNIISLAGVPIYYALPTFVNK